MPEAALDTHAEVRKLKQAGCPDEQAVVMVDLVNRAPLNATVAMSLEKLHVRFDSIESRLDGMATKSDLEVLRAETKAGLEDLRAEMSRMFWIQGGVLGTLILGLATIMLGLAL